jgi:hypothetical protein
VTGTALSSSEMPWSEKEGLSWSLLLGEEEVEGEGLIAILRVAPVAKDERREGLAVGARVALVEEDLSVL